MIAAKSALLDRQSCRPFPKCINCKQCTYYTVNLYSSQCAFFAFSLGGLENFVAGAIIFLCCQGGGKMVDSLDQAARSAVMARIRSKNTGPEMTVRKLVFAAGYRYRLHVRKLPGSPDLVFPSRKKIIFVHGCFWHRHDNCASSRIPKSRADFWSEKLNGNKARDERNHEALLQLGWQILVVWECELGNLATLEQKMRLFLDSPCTENGSKKGPSHEETGLITVDQQ